MGSFYTYHGSQGHTSHFVLGGHYFVFARSNKPEAVLKIAATLCGRVDGQTNQRNFTIIHSNLQQL